LATPKIVSILAAQNARAYQSCAWRSTIRDWLLAVEIWRLPQWHVLV